MKRAVFILFSIGALWLIVTSLVHFMYPFGQPHSSKKFDDFITPREMTGSAIGESFYRIHLYAKANKKLPTSIAEFPQRDGYANSTKDGWGNKLIYEIRNNGIITLSSLGADQKEGGKGNDADISRSYRSTDKNGSFIAGKEMWIVNGELHTNN